MIDAKLQAELRAKFNPDGSELRNMQLRMLEILKYVDAVCNDNGIRYWLSSGTCLGAVRHGGFIPWDDDLDIEMLKEDYERLIEILEAEESQEFALQNSSTDPGYFLDFAKVRDIQSNVNENFGVDSHYKYKGLFIDIFSMESSGSYRLHYICGRIRVMEIYLQRYLLNIKAVGRPVFKIVHGINNFIISLCKPLDKINAGTRLRHKLGVSFVKARNKKDIFPLRYINFENIEVPVPNDYDSYLSKLYGDYMKINRTHNHLKQS